MARLLGRGFSCERVASRYCVDMTDPPTDTNPPVSTATDSGPATHRPLVVMDKVNKFFGTLHVLKDIDLTIGEGEVVVIIGPSGSGKSTLCRTINRLETLDSGTIQIDGVSLPDEGKDLATLRADVGMVFQSFNLFARKTIRENVTLGPIRVRGLDTDRANQASGPAAVAGRHHRAGRQVPCAALWWPAAARGHCPRPCHGAQGHALSTSLPPRWTPR